MQVTVLEVEGKIVTHKVTKGTVLPLLYTRRKTHALIITVHKYRMTLTVDTQKNYQVLCIIYSTRLVRTHYCNTCTNQKSYIVQCHVATCTSNITTDQKESAGCHSLL